MFNLSGKRVLITGASGGLGGGIARSMHAQGAELAFTYQNDRLADRVKKLAGHFDSDLLIPCDVAHDQDIDQLMLQLKTDWQHIDILVHSVAFAPSDQLEGHFLNNITKLLFSQTYK